VAGHNSYSNSKLSFSNLILISCAWPESLHACIGKFLSWSRSESVTAAIEHIELQCFEYNPNWDRWTNTIRGFTVFQTSEQVMVLIEGSDVKVPDRERAYQSTVNNSQPIKLVQPGSQSTTSRMKRGIRGRSKDHYTSSAEALAGIQMTGHMKPC
jgi:hypothetical protein